MKTWKLSIVLILFIASCECNKGKDKPGAPDTTLLIPDTLLVYDVNNESKTLKRYTEVPDSAFTAARVVNGLNEKYPNVQLQLLRQSADTLYVAVPASEYLSERMGSAGASQWYADAVLNLTGVQGVNYVNISLQEGSHASPGVFSRKSYEDYK
ncbi:MAG: hypothetical protein K0Q66_257 [Chitinophagaceae bacterium]|jgi:hypothetical protein|nr:hypothetical protein [Chitinophagaceae bacterium]